MSCCLKKLRQKDGCLNSSATVGIDNFFNIYSMINKRYFRIQNYLFHAYIQIFVNLGHFLFNSR